MKKIAFPFILLTVLLLLAQNNNFNVANAFDFVNEFNTREEYIEAGVELNSEIADEGFVLLKNKDNFLPLKGNEHISLCGKNSIFIANNGLDNRTTSSEIPKCDLIKSLEDVGFNLNQDLIDFYNDVSLSGAGRFLGSSSSGSVYRMPIGETPLSSYGDDILKTFDNYKDAAIFVVTRTGGFSYDLPRLNAVDSIKDSYTYKHQLELSNNELDLLNEIKKHTENVIVLINSSNIFQCNAFENDDKIKAVLWIGHPGDVGVSAVGRILTGRVNPSGRTVDTWPRIFENDPTWQNFGDNSQTNLVYNEKTDQKEGVPQDTMFAADGAPMMSWGINNRYINHNEILWSDEANRVVSSGVDKARPASYISYEEGIYLDYRYYETRYADMAKINQEEADNWYKGDNGVIYPFGYGISYTSFKQKITAVSPINSKKLSKDDDLISVEVEVTNTGTMAGKDVVQAYWKAPYVNGEIEKADRVLCAYEKTGIIHPGKSEKVYLTMHLQDLANYDWNDANHNNFSGYELDGGKYTISVNKNAHEEYDSIDLNLNDSGIQFKTDRYTGTEVKNRFSNKDFFNTLPTSSDIEFTQMSRSDFIKTASTHPTFIDRTVKKESRFEEFLTHEFTIDEVDSRKQFDYIPQDAYKTEQDAIDGKFSQANVSKRKAERIQLNELVDLKFDDSKWNDFINEFTYEEMIKFIENHKLSSPTMESIGKPAITQTDNTEKFGIINWACSPTIAATFNRRLAKKQGEYVGFESKFSGKQGWLAPACNLHRSPFGGKNYGFYSADAFLSGTMCSEVVKAATKKGVICYVKYFGCHEQTTNSLGVATFLNEQTLRELYLKPFQYVVQNAKTIGILAAYNRVGLIESAGNYRLLTNVLREEWGFKGAVLSDMTHSGNGYINYKCYENVTFRTLSGCNAQWDITGFSGATGDIYWDDEMKAPIYELDGQKVVSYTWWYAVRERIKELMYMYANCNLINTKTYSLDSDIKLENVVGNVITIRTGDEINFKVILPDSMKDRKDVAIRLSSSSGLPEGLNFEKSTFVGRINQPGNYEFTVIIKSEDYYKTYEIAQNFEFKVLPKFDEIDVPIEEKNSNGFVAGICVSCGILIVAGLIIFVLLKRKIAH